MGLSLGATSWRTSLLLSLGGFEGQGRDVFRRYFHGDAATFFMSSSVEVFEVVLAGSVLLNVTDAWIRQKSTSSARLCDHPKDVR